MGYHNFIIMESNQFTNHVETQVDEENEFPMTNNEIQEYKEVFDKQAFEKKQIYLASLQQHNSELIKKMKQLDKNLNLEVSMLDKKNNLNKKRFTTPKFEQMETIAVKSKFTDLEKIKKQLQLKKTGIDSLQFLLNVKQQQKNHLVKLKKQIKILSKNIEERKRIKQKSIVEDSLYSTQMLRIGKFDIYSSQIQELKSRIQIKNDKIKSKRQAFINAYKKNKSNKSISIEQDSKQSVKKEETNSQTMELKQQYENIGKTINNLKSKRASLKSSMPSLTEFERQLEKVKQKYEKMLKLMPK